MPKRGKKMNYEERLACIQQAEAGKTNRQIAEESGWSVSVIRKWRRAYQKQGAAGLSVAMGRPKHGALSAYPVAVRTAIETMRRDHPGWGPLTLLEELRQRPSLVGEGLPSRARIAAFLKEQGWVRRYARHGGLLLPPPATAQEPHEEWELDAQGKQPVAGLGEVSLVNISDVVSRVKIESYPHLWGSGLTSADYQLVLRRGFLCFGLPQRVTLDHDSVFFDNTSRSPYPSRLHLWLIGLGVDVVFIEKPPPQAHAIIERGHQTLTAQTITGQQWSNQAALWQGLDQRRDFLNRRFPSRSLGGRAPLEAFPEAIHSGRAYRPEWEADLLDLNRIYMLLAAGRWFRETNLHGEFWVGLQRYNAGRAAAYTTQEVTFDPRSQQMIAKTVGTDLVHQFPAKGLSKRDLMGELDFLTRFPTYQPALPFSGADFRRHALAQLMAGTTL